MAGDERDQGWAWGGAREDQPSAPPPAGEQPRYGQYGQYAPEAGRSPDQAVAPEHGRSPDQPAEHGRAPEQAWGRPSAPQGAPAQPQYGQHSTPQQHGPGGQQYGQYGAQQPGNGPQPVPPQHSPRGQGPQYGQYGAPSGWGAAPVATSQPGIVPLRPLNLGEMLDGAFRAIRANPRVMFGLSLIVMAVVAVIDAIVSWALLDQADALLAGDLTPEAMATVGASALVSALLASIAATFATVILTGLLILSVSQSVLGRVLSLPALWQQARGQVWRLVGQTLLVGVITIAAMLAAMVVALLVVTLLTGVTGGGDAAGLAVFFGVLLVLALMFVAGAWLGVRLSLAAPALMLERARVIESLRRSWGLTRGHFWRIFGVLAVSIIIVLIASGALMVPIGVVTGLMFQTETLSLAPLLVSNVLSVLISAVTVPFIAAVLALVYVDVRMRSEGLDVELARAAGAR